MVTLEDCLAFSGLSEDEILAIAEHEHIPEIAAAALAEYLLGQDDGAEKIRRMISDDICDAIARGDTDHARMLGLALRHFIETHPQVPQAAQQV